jgi:nucleoside-diphosphate-sugar epimerase
MFSGIGLYRNPPITKAGLRFLGTSRHIDISRARQELGYAPHVTMQVGLPRYIDWLLEQTRFCFETGLPWLWHLGS